MPRRLRLSLSLLLALGLTSACADDGTSSGSGGPLLLVTSNLNEAVTGRPYFVALQGSGGVPPYSFALKADISDPLPAGLTLTEGGVIGGIPTAAGAANLVISLSDAAGNTAPTDGKLFLAVAEGLRITTESLPTGKVGEAYAVSIFAEGGTAPYRFSTPDMLPAGISLSPEDGLLVGTPVNAGTHILRIDAVDSSDPPQLARETFALTIAEALTLVPSALPAGAVREPYTHTFLAIGGAPPYAFTVADGDALPPGLNLGEASGQLSGSPAQGGEFSFTVVVTDSADPQATDSLALTLSIRGAFRVDGERIDDGVLGEPYLARLAASFGTPPLQWQAEGATPPGLELSEDGRLFGLPTQLGDYDLEVEVRDSRDPQEVAQATLALSIREPLALAADALPTATVDVAYTESLGISGGLAPYTVTLGAGSSVPAGLGLDAENDFAGTPTAVGSGTIIFVVQDSATPPQLKSFSVAWRVAGTLDAQDGALPQAAVGVDYDAPLPIEGGRPPYAISLTTDSALPAGLAIEAGRLVGTPEEAGDYGFTLDLRDASDPPAEGSLTLSLAVLPQLDLSALALPVGTLSAEYTHTLSAAGPDDVVLEIIDAAQRLPMGLSWDADGATLSGTPEETGRFSLTVTASSAGPPLQQDSIDLDLRVVAPLALNVPAALTTVPDAFFETTFEATGGEPPYTLALGGEALPDTLSFDPDAGTLSGTPTEAADYALTLTLTDSGTPPRLLEQDFALAVLVVLPEPPARLPDGVVSEDYSANLNPEGFEGAFTWEILEGELPTGLDLDEDTGEVSGLPTAARDVLMFVRGTEVGPAGRQIEGLVRLQIALGLQITSPSLPKGIVGASYFGGLIVTGGIPSYRFSVDPEGDPLPAGLSLLENLGSIVGSPTESGEAEVTFIVTDRSDPPQEGRRSYLIRVVERLEVAEGPLPDGTVGELYNHRLVRTGGEAPISFGTAAGSWPNGILLNGVDGIVLGTPSEAAQRVLVIEAIDEGTPRQREFVQVSIDVRPPVTLADDQLPAGFLGQRYDAALPLVGGKPPYFVDVQPGSLPAGMVLPPTGDRLQGVPGEPGQHRIAFTARDSGNPPRTLATTITFPVGELLALESTALPEATEGAAYDYAIPATGGVPPYRWRVDNGVLPPGLRLGELNGRITGTPLATGESAFTLEVRDAGAATQSLTRLFKLVVRAPLAFVSQGLPPAIVDAPYAAQLEARGGVPPYRFDVDSGALPDGLTLADNGLISGTASSAGRHSLTLRVEDASSPPAVALLPVDLDVVSALAITPERLAPATRGTLYDADFGVVGGRPPYRFEVIAGVLPDGLTLDANSGALTGAAEQSGEFPLLIEASDSGAPPQRAQRSYVLRVAEPISVEETTLPDCIVGRSYSAQLRSEGGIAPHSFALLAGGLPPGLVLDPNSGEIRGSCTGLSLLYAFGVVARDGVREGSATLRIEVVQPLEVLPGDPLTTEAGEPFDFTLSAQGGREPLQWRVLRNALPAGLVLDPAGDVTGPAAESGVFEVIFEVEDAGQPPQRDTKRVLFNFTAGLTISTTALPDAIVDELYTFALASAGGSAPFVYSVAAGAPPTGITVGADGVITGTANATEAQSFDVVVCDAAPANCSRRSFLLRVVDALNIQTAALPDAVVGQPYDADLLGVGGTAPRRWALTGGTLPAGLGLDAEGHIVGVPQAAGAPNLTFELSDAGTPPQRQDVTLALVVRERLEVSVPALPRCVVGTPLGDVPLTAQGGAGPWRFEATGGALPAGLEISEGGILRGQALEAGDFVVTVTVSDNATPVQTFSWDLALACDHPLLFAPGQLPRALLGRPFDAPLNASGGRPPYRFEIVDPLTLPVGLSIDVSGRVAGVPAGVGESSFALRVRDSGSPELEVVADATLLVRTPIALAFAELTDIDEGEAVAVDLEASGGVPPYAFDLAGGALPQGLRLEADGRITGNAEQVGRFELDLRIADSDTPPQLATLPFVIEVDPVRNGEGCFDAIILDLSEGELTVAGDTSDAAEDLRGNCAGEGVPDRVYTFSLDAQSRVDFLLDAPEFEAALHLRSAPCLDGDELGCWIGEDTAHVARVLEPGLYYLTVDGFGLETGAYTLTVRSSPIVAVGGDSCDAAVDLLPDPETGFVQISGNTLGATDTRLGGCGGDGGEVIYRFQVESASSVRVELETFDTFAPALYLVDAPCETGAERFCSSPLPGEGPAAGDVALSPGSYYLVVDSANEQGGIYDLALRIAGDRPFESCENAGELLPDLATGIATVRGTTRLGADDYSGSCAGEGAPDSVYSFTLDTPREVAITLTDLGEFESVLYLRRGVCEGDDELACIIVPVPQRIVEPLDAGTWFVFVDGLAAGQEGAYELTLELSGAPINGDGGDTCETALPLQFDVEGLHAVAVGNTSRNTSQLDPGPSCASVLHDAPDSIYSFTLPAPRNVRVTLDDEGGSFDSVLYVYSNGCGVAPPVCVDDPEPQIIIGELPAGEHFIVVDGFAENTGGYRLEVEIEPPPDPGPNDCALAEVATLVPDEAGVSFEGSFNLVVTDTQAATCGGTGNPDHVYEIIAGGEGILQVSVDAPDFDPVLSLRESTDCDTSAPDEIACVQGSSLTRRVNAGIHYLILDSAIANSIGDYQLDLRLDPLVLTGGESCADAETIEANLDGRALLYGDIGGAADDEASSCVASSPDRLYHFELLAPRSVQLTAEGEGFVPALSLRSDECAAGPEVDCGAGGSAGTIRAVLPAGHYFVLVEATDGVGGNYVLDVDLSADRVAADLCPGARIALTDSSFATADDLFDASDRTQLSCGGADARDKIYKLVISEPGTLEAQVDATFPARLGLRSDSCAGGIELACDDGSAGPTAISAAVSAGVHWIIVDGANDRAIGAFNLNVDFTPDAP